MIIFHFPDDLSDDSDRPSRIRPFKILEAFKKHLSIDGVVEAIGKRREQNYPQIFRDIDNGRVQFLYAESLNKPLMVQCLLEGKINILSDYFFFFKCKRKKIKQALFYRDAQWLTNDYRKIAPRFCYWPLKWIFYLEFKVFEYLFDILFLPSKEMAEYLPLGKSNIQVAALPPGIDEEKIFSGLVIKDINSDINLLYVGGVSPVWYDIGPLLNAIRSQQGVFLNICCRSQDWEEYGRLYNMRDVGNVNVYNVKHNDIGAYYTKAHVHIIFFPRTYYREFAVPFKFYESLQFGLPIISNEGTKVAQLVKELDVGWVVKDANDLENLLLKLKHNHLLINEKRKNIYYVARENTWGERVNKIIRYFQY